MTAITIDRASLTRAMALLSRAVERRTTIPILGNVRLVAAGRTLTLTATDLDIEVQTVLDCTSDSDGATTVAAHLLHDLTRKAGDGPLNLAWGETGPLTLKAGRSRFTLHTIPVADFPDLQRGEQPCRFVMPAPALADLISHTEFAQSTEETRYYLNGIYFHRTDTDSGPALRCVATDGHRLALYDVPAPQGSEDMPGIIIPRKSVGEIARLLKEAGDSVDLAVSAAKITVQAGQTTLTTKLVDGTYPDYSRVIPRGNSIIAGMAREDLMRAVDRVSTVAPDTRAVRFSFADGVLKLSVTNPDHGTSEEEMSCTLDGTPVEIGFNGRYVIDMAAALPGETITMALGDNGSPALVRATDAPDMLCIIMPMRV